MKLRPGPVVALVLLAGLGTWVYLSEFRGAEARRKAEEAKDKALPFERAALEAVVLKGPDGTLRLQRDGDAWTITQPLKTRADKDAVEGLLSSLESGRIERRLGTSGDRKAYGLEPPPWSITVETKAGGSRTLSLGDSEPIGGSYYALLPGGQEVGVVSASLGEAAKKDLLGLRDKTIVSLDPWKVKKLTLEHGHETVVLEKPDAGWKISSPIEAPAEGPTVTEILSALERLRATAFAAEKATDADLKQDGLEPPAARVTLRQEGWDTDKTVLFGAPHDKGRYVRAVGRDPIVVVDEDIWKKVTTSLDDLRRKEVLGLSQYRVDSVTAARRGGPALVLKKEKEGGWTASGAATGPVKGDTVDALLRLVGDVKAASFDDHPPRARLDALGKNPVLDLTLEEEPDAEGGAPRHQHLLFGAPRKDGRMPVRDLAWTPIALADGKAIAKIDAQIDTVVQEASKATAAAAKAPASSSPAAAPAGATAAAPAKPAKPGGR